MTTDLQWILLLLYVAVLVGFFTVGPRSRGYIFVGLLGIGAITGLYGYLVAGKGLFFQRIGLPLSLVIVLSLCFGALVVDKTFSGSVLKQKIYPLLCILFCLWSIMDLWNGVSLFRHSRVIPIWHCLSLLLTIAAFSSAAMSIFSLRWFQLFLPLMFVSYFFSLAEGFQFEMISWSFDRVSNPDVKKIVKPPPEIANLVRQFFLAGGVWGLFKIFGYMYINTKANPQRLKQKFVGKLPQTGVMLVACSFLYQFPEFLQYRDLLPISNAIAENILMGIDLALVPIFLGASGWPFVKARILTFLSPVAILSLAVLIMVLLYNPFKIAADAGSQKHAKEFIRIFTSWNSRDLKVFMDQDPDTRTKGDEVYDFFATNLGPVEEVVSTTGHVYTLFTYSPNDLKVGIFLSEIVFEKANAKMTTVMRMKQGVWQYYHFDLFWTRREKDK